TVFPGGPVVGPRTIACRVPPLLPFLPKSGHTICQTLGLFFERDHPVLVSATLAKASTRSQMGAGWLEPPSATLPRRGKISLFSSFRKEGVPRFASGGTVSVACGL